MSAAETQFTGQDYLDAMDVLQRASAHIGEQYSDHMPRPEAAAHFAARALLLGCRMRTHNEAVALFCPEEKPITREELDLAIAEARGSRRRGCASARGAR